MKKDLLFGVLVLFQVYVFGQSFKEGVYENRKSCVTVCIHKDTLLYYHKSNVATLYYGYASIVDDKLSLGNNLALGINTRVDTCRNDSRFVEIELYELYKDIIFGERLPNMAPHHIKSNLFTLHFNDKIKIIDDTIVKLSVQEFYPSVGEVKMTIFGGSFSGYQDEVTLPITVGVKYTLTQKYYRCQPLLNDIKPLIRVGKKRNQLKLYFYDPSKSRWVKMEYKRKCVSCYEELKKLLLEE